MDGQSRLEPSGAMRRPEKPVRLQPEKSSGRKNNKSACGAAKAPQALFDAFYNREAQAMGRLKKAKEI